MTVALLWMIAAYGAAPRVPVWQPAPVLAWVPLLVMPFAAILLVAGLTSPHPTLVGGERFLDGAPGRARKSVVAGPSVSVRVDLGGRGLITKKHTNNKTQEI